MPRRYRSLALAAFVTGLLCLQVPPCFGEVKLHVLFKSDMVLQRDMPVPVWGTAAPGEEVTVGIAGNTAGTKSGADGRWTMRLKPMKAGGPHTMTVKGTNEVKLENVLVGDVWFCGGQSNMSMTVQSSMNAVEEAAGANFKRIRFFRMPRGDADEPRKDLPWGAWQVCTSQTAGGFSGVGYFFGRRLHKDLDVPIGLIMCEWGGTAAEAWTSMAALKAEPDFKRMLDMWEQSIRDFTPEKRAAYEKVVAEYTEAVRKAQAEGKKRPRRPRRPRALSVNRPSALYNYMVSPLMPFAIKGVIWYQGEANASRAMQYRKLLPTLIRNWRQGFGHDFPFLIVQLANFTRVVDKPGESGWAELREAQFLTARDIPGCGLACAIDVGEAGDIHPKNKQFVGERLALVALTKVYGKDLVHSGPVFDSMNVEGNKVRLTFKHAGGGLTTRTSDIPNGPNMRQEGYKFALGDGPVKGFAIAGEDGTFVWAEAKIEGKDTVVVRSEKVAKPVAVRYAWANNPVCNLYNKEGLPAVPFRTDDGSRK